MHYCGIIVKHKSIKVEQARTIFGDALVKREVSDWYSVNEYRERTFDGVQVISLKEFIEKHFNEFIKDNDSPLAFCVIDENDFMGDLIIPSEFFEFYDFKGLREQLLSAYRDCYVAQLEKLLSTEGFGADYRNRDMENYNVCLIDYHN